MKKILSIVVAVLLLAFPLQVRASSDYSTAHATVHEIVEITLTGAEACSATAIGPHALLTASHCEQPTDVISVDDNDDVKILKTFRDKHDHTIYVVDMTFSSFSKVSKRPLSQGEDVFLFGNPGKMEDVLRKGYIAAIYPEMKSLFGTRPGMTVYDLNAFEGDSGAAMFDSNGLVISVLSGGAVQKSKDGDIKLIVCYDILFSQDLLNKIQEGK